MPGDPFEITKQQDPGLKASAIRAAEPLLSWLLQLNSYRSIYEEIRVAPQSTPFDARALAALGINVVSRAEDVAFLPPSGPVVVAANHPHGVLDGLVLATLVRRARPDMRILTNHLLSRIPELDDLCFYVDPFGGPAAAARSRAGLRAARLWLKAGGALVVFPAGEVAHGGRHRDGTYVDSPWSVTAGRLALSTGAQVVPAFVSGANSMTFYAAGRIHPALRTALLARELLRKRGQNIAVRLGTPVSSRNLAARGVDADGLTVTVRRAVESLAPSPTQQTARGRETDAVAWDIAKLPATALLVESGEYQVFVSAARQIPSALREIGRLRERTYQSIGEGTGRTLDLDAFDNDYLHLFLWDRAQRQIVGAYRLGLTDRIMAMRGVDGLYTRTLFRYDERLIARLTPALELGRSFVRAEYQKDYSPLLLLWKGIGQFVIRHPQYRVLFGPVSISSRYSDSSHQLLMSFLRQNHLDRDLAELVDAVNPDTDTRTMAPATTIPHSIDEANRLVAQAEADGKGVPVLLRQYLKLNARLLGFNVDPDFGDALDALMMVDLTAVSPGILTRYLGRVGTADFLARHLAKEPANAA